MSAIIRADSSTYSNFKSSVFHQKPETCWKSESASKKETKPFKSDAAALNLLMSIRTTYTA